MNQRTTYSEMFCFVAGGLAGAGLVWLWAPASGKVAHKMIGRKLRDAAEGARELKDDLVAKGEQMHQEAERLGGDAVSTIADEAGLGKGR